MEQLVSLLKQVDNGTWVDGYGYVAGYDQVHAIRGIAGLIENNLERNHTTLIFNLLMALTEEQRQRFACLSTAYGISPDKEIAQALAGLIANSEPAPHGPAPLG